MNIPEIQRKLSKFADERDWNQFHSPKNLSMALMVEAAELLEHFQWLTESESNSLDEGSRQAVATEIADIQIYLTLIAGKLGIDIEKAVISKIESNAIKYPTDVVSTTKNND